MNKFQFTSMRKVLILSASFFLLFQSCKKEGELNPDFAEDTSSNQFTESIELTSRTVKSDSVFADQIATGLIGLYQDSVFGKAINATHVQPLLPSNSVVFGESNETFTTDSVVISLEYDGIFGDTLTQTFEVYQVDEILDVEKEYSSNYQVATTNSLVGSRTFTPNLKDNQFILRPDASGNIDSIQLAPQLRIKLDNALGDLILSKSGQTEVSNNQNFTSFFKGLKIQPKENTPLTNNTNAILYFALTASNTKMTIYYTATNSNNGSSIKKSVDFPINSSSVRFNTFAHDYTNGSVLSALQQNTPDSLFSYVQAMAGVQTRIKLPGLDSLKGSNVVINKAELVLPAASGSYDLFGKADKLVLAALDANGDLQFIDDFFEGSSYFGGTYNSSEDSYRFNISRYVQGLLNGSETKEELTVLVSGGAINAERVVLFGPKHPNKRIKLNLYLSNTQ